MEEALNAPQPAGGHTVMWSAAAQHGGTADKPGGGSAAVPRGTIDAAELQMGDRMGAGAGGVVLHGTWRGTRCAVKRVHYQARSLGLKMEGRHVCSSGNAPASHPPPCQTSCQ